jgi:rhomboid protease GluP
MPEQKQSFSYPGNDSPTLLNMAYGSLVALGWTTKYAGENILVAYTPRSWKKYDDEITIETTDNNLTVTSKLVHGEAFDMLGKNKKHIEEFITAFEKTKATNAEINPEWTEAIEQLKQQTLVAASEEIQKAEAVDKVMKQSGSDLYATYAIIAINVLVFILMAINGAGIFDTNGVVHIKWGSNYSALTLSGDWWRLITNVFIHFGLIHLAMNIYAFYTVGVYLEPMLGKARYVTAYLCTGVIASIVSLWWHKDGVNSAGASGAIFGIYGVFLALLFTNLIPKQIRNALLSSIGIFVVFNLLYGMKSGVDNSAHIGGLLSGLVIGFVYYLLMKKEEGGDKKQFVLAVIIAATIAITWFYLNSNKNTISEKERKEAQMLVRTISYKDGEKYIEKINAFIELENTALAPLNDSSLNNVEIAERLNNISVGEWENAKNMLQEMKTYDVSDIDKQKTLILEEYIDARVEEINIINEVAKEEKNEDYERLKAIREKITGMINKLTQLK